MDPVPKEGDTDKYAQLAEPEPTQDLGAVIGRLLQDMQVKFEDISTRITSKLDEMGERVEQLEQNVQGLMDQIDESEKAEK